MDRLGVSGREKGVSRLRSVCGKACLQSLVGRQTSMIQERVTILGWLGDFWANADGLLTSIDPVAPSLLGLRVGHGMG